MCFEAVPLVMHLVFIRIPRESYRRRLSLFLVVVLSLVFA